jgi:enoyl-CoA hydratase
MGAKIKAEALEAWIAAGEDPAMCALETGGAMAVVSPAPIDVLGGEYDAWLARFPAPTIAIMPKGAAAPTGFDVVVDSEGEAERLFAAILARPISAMTLIQTLRLVVKLDSQMALTVESLAYGALQQGPEFVAWQRARGRPDPASVVEEGGPPVVIARDGDRLSIILNRPESRNEMSTAMRDGLWEALLLVAADRELTRVDVRGAGDSFSTGGALAEFGLVPSGAEGHRLRSLRMPARLLAEHGGRFVFHLHGACIGAGIELAAFGREVRARSRSFFQLPELSMGLIPGSGGCVSITRRIGRQRAGWLMLSGRRIGPQTALAWGLIDAIED